MVTLVARLEIGRRAFNYLKLEPTSYSVIGRPMLRWENMSILKWTLIEIGVNKRNWIEIITKSLCLVKNVIFLILKDLFAILVFCE